MGKVSELKAQRRRQRRCVLLFLAAAVVVTFLAYERDEVVRDAELILHHNLTNHGEARAAPVATEKGYILPDAATKRDPTIFVSAIAFREPECHPTLKDMFAKAAIPERVYAGVCQQNLLPAGSPEDCAPNKLPKPFQNHVKVFAMNSSEAQGIPLARARASQQYDGQDYWLQIDAHSRFDQGWDQRLIDEHSKIKECDPKAMLSTYPPGIEDMGLDAKQQRTALWPRICNGSFSGGPRGNVFRLDGQSFPSQGFAVRTPFAAGGFMFGPGQILRDVPHDPDMPFLFDGDEILFSVRLFTAGWNVWAPSEQVVYHRYVSYGERNNTVYAEHSDEEWYPLEGNSTARILYLLGQTDQMPPKQATVGLAEHGLGKARDLDAWTSFTGVDFKHVHHVGAGDKFCRDVRDLPMDMTRVCPVSTAAKKHFDEAQKEKGGR